MLYLRKSVSESVSAREPQPTLLGFVVGVVNRECVADQQLFAQALEPTAERFPIVAGLRLGASGASARPSQGER